MTYISVVALTEGRATSIVDLTLINVNADKTIATEPWKTMKFFLKFLLTVMQRIALRGNRHSEKHTRYMKSVD